MRVLGISAFYHDSAAALVEDGRIIAAAQEERFTRKKHDASFPSRAISYCLEEGRTSLDDLDNVVFYDKPFLKFERLMETYVALAPRGFRSFQMAIPLWLREKLFQKSLLRRELRKLSESFDGRNNLLFCGTSSKPRGIRLLSVSFPKRRRPHDGWRWGVGDNIRRIRGRPAPGNIPGDTFPPLAWFAVFGSDVLRRVQGQLGRIQGDGASALW